MPSTTKHNAEFILDQMGPVEILRKFKEETPLWLKNCRKDTIISLQDFLSSNVVFYPGSGTDGHPLKIFGGSHSAHSFIFADYIIKKEDIWAELSDDRHPKFPKGYHLFSLNEVPLDHLLPLNRGQRRNIYYEGRFRQKTPYAIMAVLERNLDRNEDHGPARIAVLYIGDEAFEIFDTLFCQKPKLRPFAIVIQDHGLGCLWSPFGGSNSLMYRIALQHDVLPKFLFVGMTGGGPTNGEWPNYRLLSDKCEYGGMHNIARRLFGRNDQSEPTANGDLL